MSHVALVGTTVAPQQTIVLKILLAKLANMSGNDVAVLNQSVCSSAVVICSDCLLPEEVAPRALMVFWIGSMTLLAAS